MRKKLYAEQMLYYCDQVSSREWHRLIHEDGLYHLRLCHLVTWHLEEQSHSHINDFLYDFVGVNTTAVVCRIEQT